MGKINIEKETLEKLFIEQNLTIKEISERLNCSTDTIRRRLQKFGLKKGTSYKPPKEKIDPLADMKNSIKELYLSGKSCSEIGKILNLSEKTISYHLHKMNVKIRSTKKMDQATFEKLWNEGKTDKEIAKIMNVAINTVKSFRTRGNNAGKFNIIRNFSQTEQHLSYKQEQFILGSLLGDMNLSNPNCNRSQNSRLAIVHSIKQEELFMKKVELLGDFMGNWKLYTSSQDKRTGKTYQTYRGNSKAHSVFTELWKLVYPDGQKRITKEFLDKISSPIALAYWFMDDGCEDGVIATNSFSIEECELLVDWLLNKWNIKASLQKNKTNYVIYIRTGSRYDFENLIFPYIIPSMYYKLKYANELLENKN